MRVRWLTTLLDIRVGAAPGGCLFRRSAVGLAALFVLLLPVPTWSQSVDELLSNPAAFDRQKVKVTGQVTTLIVEEGEKPYTKFKLHDASGEISVFMRGVQALTEGESYEVDGVFLVKPASDGSTQVSGIVGQTVLPLEQEPLAEEPLEFAEEETAEEFESQGRADELAESEETAADDIPSLLVADLLEDPEAFDRQVVSLAGAVSTLRVTEGDNPSIKFKLHDASGEIPVFMRGVQALTEGERYEVGGVFLVKPAGDGSTQISGIVGQTILPLEREPQTEEPLEFAEEETAEEFELQELEDEPLEFEEAAVEGPPGLLVADLLEDPAAFDRLAISLAGEVTTLRVTEGDNPSTRFKLHDVSGEIPVFMRGVGLLTEGESYEVDGVFLVKPTNDGTGEVSGIVAGTVEPVEAETAPVPVAAAPTDEPAAPPAYTAPVYAVRDLLADQAQFDRRFVSVTGQVTSLTTRYGARTYQKFKLTDSSGTIPVFIPGTSSCELDQICKVTGVFLIKRTQGGESEISGIKADAIEKVEDAPYLQWASTVFRERLGEPGSNTRLPGGFAIPE